MRIIDVENGRVITSTTILAAYRVLIDTQHVHGHFRLLSLSLCNATPN